MRYWRPAFVELVVNVVINVVTALAEVVDAQHPHFLLRRRLVFTAPPGVDDRIPAFVLGLLDVFTARTVTAFATHVFQQRRVLLVAETRFVTETDRVTDDALGIMLPQRRLFGLHQRIEGVRMLRLFPHVIGFA